MKKTIRVLVCMILMGMLGTALAESAEAPAFLGDWYLDYLTEDGERYSAEELEVEVKVTLTGDGKCLYLLDDELSETYTWFEGEEGLTVNLYEVPMMTTFTQGCMVLEGDGLRMVYTRDLATYVSAAETGMYIEHISAFDGKWKFEKMSAYGTIMKQSEVLSFWQTQFGFQDYVVAIENGNVSLFGKDAVRYEQQDNLLQDPENGCRISLAGDGVICVNWQGMDFFCRKSE